MNTEYIYEPNKNKELGGSEAIIMLPDIYMQTEYSKQTAEKFAEAFKRRVFMLDYFFISTHQKNTFSENDREQIMPLFQNFKGDDFKDFFKKVLGEIKSASPTLKNFAVIGFCFGGRLAYIAGREPEISIVISFYGGGANTPNYVDGKSPSEYLADRKDIKIVSFFGTEDPSISEEDRKILKEKFAGMAYETHEYPVGHAYFQEGRKNFDEMASKNSWEVLRKIFNG